MPNGPTMYPTLGATVRDCASHVQGFYPASADQLDAVADGIDDMATELARTRRELTDSDVITRGLREQIEHWSQSHSELAAGYNRLCDRYNAAEAYIEAQPCMCPTAELRTDPDAEPCARCKVLGLRNDEPVEQ